MITRRKAVHVSGLASAGAWFAAAQIGLIFPIAPSASAAKGDSYERRIYIIVFPREKI